MWLEWFFFIALDVGGFGYGGVGWCDVIWFGGGGG